MTIDNLYTYVPMVIDYGLEYVWSDVIVRDPFPPPPFYSDNLVIPEVEKKWRLDLGL